MKVLLFFCFVGLTLAFNLKIYNMNVTSTDLNVCEIVKFSFHGTKYNVTAMVKKPLHKIMVIKNLKILNDFDLVV